ncbi:MAG TPA: glutamate--tRNA ligase family protein [Candidatus Limnocylindrales bacterium]|nr:glutamate--tRNA ligase family protein [Candidatus Limnocylindrales bacterium]
MGEAAFGAAFRTAIEALPRGLRTRFAPAPTGYLHLGHVANALAVWGAATATGGTVVLRIEDHDRQRCRPAFEAAILDDLEALGFEPDEPSIAALRTGEPSPWRQSDNDAAYTAAVAVLDGLGLVYACDCSRATFSDWAAEHGERWRGPGCPGACAARGIPRATAGVAWRVALGDADEAWTDLVLGSRAGSPAAGGDLPIRDRHGNWTYALCVVVDDIRHDIGLVVRGEDLLQATPAQVRLGSLLGRGQPPRFLHHPLIHRPDGRKLSKADGATGVRELLREGTRPAELRRRAAAAIGLA